MIEGHRGSDLEAVRSARSIAPEVERNADYGEAHGLLAPGSVDALRRAGLLRLWRPQTLGGHECHPVEYAEAAEEIAAADTAAGWFMMHVANTTFDLRYAPPGLIEEVFRDGDDPVLCATFNRPMKAALEDGTLRVSGATPFASGCRHADWIGHTALHDDRMLLVFHPAGALRIEDDWDSLGLRGSASNTIVAEGVAVPEHRIIDLGAPRYHPSYEGCLYRLPEAILTSTFPPVALGALRGALDCAQEIAETKVPFASGTTLKHRHGAQLSFGWALSAYRAARTYFHASLEAAYDQARRGDPFTLRDKADLFLACAHALQSCNEAVRRVARAVGTSSVYRGNPIERALRDTEVISHHAFGAEGRFASVAQAYWDVEVDFPLMAMD